MFVTWTFTNAFGILVETKVAAISVVLVTFDDTLLKLCLINQSNCFICPENRPMRSISLQANEPIRTYLSKSRAVVSAFFNFVFPEDDTFLVFW